MSGVRKPRPDSGGLHRRDAPKAPLLHDDDFGRDALNSSRERAFPDSRQDRRQPDPRGDSGGDLPRNRCRSAVPNLDGGPGGSVSPRRRPARGVMACAPSSALLNRRRSRLSICSGRRARGDDVRRPQAGRPRSVACAPRRDLASSASLASPRGKASGQAEQQASFAPAVITTRCVWLTRRGLTARRPCSTPDWIGCGFGRCGKQTFQVITEYQWAQAVTKNKNPPS